jgi:hypothetical protein
MENPLAGGYSPLASGNTSDRAAVTQWVGWGASPASAFAAT